MSDLDAEWARCSHWIADALEHAGGTHLLEDVRAEIDAREAILWPGEQSAIVTQISLFPRKRYLTFWLAGGDVDELVNRMAPEIEDFARRANFDALAIPGRAGWARAMAPHGYRPLWTVIGKDLT